MLQRLLGVEIERLNELENIYKDQIFRQIKKGSGKDHSSQKFTVKFSFLSVECFDAMQLTDVLIHLVRKKLEQGETGIENVFTQIFDKYFLSDPLNYIRFY